MKPLKLLNTFLKMRSKRYLLSRLLEVVLGYPLYVFSFLCIRNRNKWLFGTNVEFTDNAKYLFIYDNEQKRSRSSGKRTRQQDDARGKNLAAEI